MLSSHMTVIFHDTLLGVSALTSQRTTHPRCLKPRHQEQACRFKLQPQFLFWQRMGLWEPLSGFRHHNFFLDLFINLSNQHIEAARLVIGQWCCHETRPGELYLKCLLWLPGCWLTMLWEQQWGRPTKELNSKPSMRGRPCDSLGHQLSSWEVGAGSMSTPVRPKWQLPQIQSLLGFP